MIEVDNDLINMMVDDLYDNSGRYDYTTKGVISGKEYMRVYYENLGGSECEFFPQGDEVVFAEDVRAGEFCIEGVGFDNQGGLPINEHQPFVEAAVQLDGIPERGGRHGEGGVDAIQQGAPCGLPS